MKKILILIILILVVQNCFPQSGWFWQNPKPLGLNINDGAFLNNNIVFLIGDGGTLMKSTNGGVNWTYKNILPSNDSASIYLYSISAIDENTLRIYGTRKITVGNSFDCYATNDGGKTWTKSIISSGWGALNYKKIRFTDADNGWFYDLALALIFKTTNGGMNWTNISINGNSNLTYLFFLNNNTGWTGYLSQYYKTTNGGNNWTAYSIDNFQQPFFINENTGWLGGRYKTTNGGINFSQISSGVGFNNFYFENENSGWGYNNGVYRTTNSGVNWFLSIPLETSTGNAAFFGNNALGLGANGFLARTSNGGANWNTLSSSVVNYQNNIDASFIDENTGWVLSDSKIIKTTNGGNSWLTQDTNAYYNVIKFLNASTGFCAGLDKIVKTVNGGVTWTPYNYSGLNFYSCSSPGGNSIFFLATGSGASDRYVIKTTDGGNSFSTKNLNSFSYSTVQFLNDNTGFVSGYDGLFKTTNGGNSWLLPPNNYSIEKSYFINETTGFNFGFYRIEKTTNGGMNWSRIYENGYTYFTSMNFVNSLTGWAAGSADRLGLIMKTTDGGNTWRIDNNVSTYGINAINFVNTNTGWAVTDNGGIVKTVTGGSVGVFQSSTITPDKYSLSQNYPNPFNPLTRINYEIKSSGFVSLKVFDLLGKEVTTLVNEKQNAGSYVVDFNSTEFNLPSGIYFYTLNAGEFKETRKMVLVK